MISSGWRQGNAGGEPSEGSEDGTTVRNPRPQDAGFGHGLWLAAEPLTGLVDWT
jgi:hypothetical protein